MKRIFINGADRKKSCFYFSLIFLYKESYTQTIIIVKEKQNSRGYYRINGYKCLMNWFLALFFFFFFHEWFDTNIKSVFAIRTRDIGKRDALRKWCDACVSFPLIVDVTFYRDDTRVTFMKFSPEQHISFVLLATTHVFSFYKFIG